MFSKDLLLLKEIEVEENIKREKEKLIKLRSYLSTLKGEQKMSDIIIKELPEVIVAYMRKRIVNHDELFNIMPNVMGKEMRRVGCICAVPEYCFNIYNDREYKELNIDVEMCEAVTELKEDTDIIKFKKIESVSTAVCIFHKGSYDSIGESYSNIFGWIKDNGYEVVGDPRESYIDGIWNKENIEDWLTEIQIPVKSIVK